jgi:hypothetical protein
MFKCSVGCTIVHYDPTTVDALGLAEALVLHGELVMVDVTELGCKEAK